MAMDALMYMSDLQNIRTFSQSQRYPGLCVILTNNPDDGNMVDTVHLVGQPESDPVFISRNRPEEGGMIASFVKDILRDVYMVYSITWAAFIDYDDDDHILTVHQISKFNFRTMFVVWNIHTRWPVFQNTADEILRTSIETNGWLTECDGYKYLVLSNCRVVKYNHQAILFDLLEYGQCGQYYVELPTFNPISIEASHDGELLLVTSIRNRDFTTLPSISVLRRLHEPFQGTFYAGCYLPCDFTDVDQQREVNVFSGCIGSFLRGKNQVYVFDLEETRATVYVPANADTGYELWSARNQIILPPDPYAFEGFGDVMYNMMTMSADGNYVFVHTAHYDYTISIDGSYVKRRDFDGDDSCTPKQRAIQPTEIKGLFVSLIQRQRNGRMALKTSSEYRFDDRQHQLLSKHHSGEEGEFSRAVFYLVCLKEISRKREESGQQVSLPHLPMAAWLEIFRFLHAAMWERI